MNKLKRIAAIESLRLKSATLFSGGGLSTRCSRRPLFVAGLALGVALELAGSAAAQTAKRPITVRDVLSVREITEQKISPDGRNVAFIVKDADIPANDYKSTLYVVSAGGSDDPKELVATKSISNLRWAPGSDAVTYIASEGPLSQVWKISITGGEPAILFRHDESISEFEWSPDGKTIAFVS